MKRAFFMKRLRYFVIYKPFGTVAQFSGDDGNLSDLEYTFPKDVYPVGRLDKDSEGLLIITNDTHLHHRMTDPKFGHKRTYFVQVEGIPDENAITRLREGVEITLPNKKKYLTFPAQSSVIPTPELPERNPPIRIRMTVPDTWISLTLTEGKNRQVRKMTAQVGHPTLRLVRAQIENLSLNNLQSGQVREYTQSEIYPLLNL